MVDLTMVCVQALGSVFLLVGFLVVTTLFQQRAMIQSTSVLETASEPVKRTILYESARAYFARRHDNPFANRAHAVSIWSLIIIVLFCSIVTYFGAGPFNRDTTPSYVLGGALAASLDAAHSGALATLARYQSSTVFTASMAFLGAYAWIIAQLVSRMNNNDMDPATYYFMSIRILTACLVAGIARHIVEAIPGLRDVIYNTGNAPVGLALLGFVIGWKPTFWIDEIYRSAADLLKPDRREQRLPSKDNLPQNMSLAMLQGMVDGKIERLVELDIDNCQKLSRENAVIIWVRTPFNQELIVDWIAQAQLVVLFEDDKLELLRRVGIRDIFAYVGAIADQQSRSSVQAILQTVPADILASHLAYIRSDPAFQRLEQLHDAIRAQCMNEPKVMAAPLSVLPASAAS